MIRRKGRCGVGLPESGASLLGGGVSSWCSKMGPDYNVFISPNLVEMNFSWWNAELLSCLMKCCVFFHPRSFMSLSNGLPVELRSFAVLFRKCETWLVFVSSKPLCLVFMSLMSPIRTLFQSELFIVTKQLIVWLFMWLLMHAAVLNWINTDFKTTHFVLKLKAFSKTWLFRINLPEATDGFQCCFKTIQQN